MFMIIIICLIVRSFLLPVKKRIITKNDDWRHLKFVILILLLFGKKCYRHTKRHEKECPTNFNLVMAQQHNLSLVKATKICLPICLSLIPFFPGQSFSFIISSQVRKRKHFILNQISSMQFLLQKCSNFTNQHPMTPFRFLKVFRT